MRTRHWFVVVGALAAAAFLAAAGAGAGDKDKKDGKDKDLGFEIPKTGPEHKMLAKLAGKWDAKVKMTDPKGGDPTESKGTMTRTMILGGRYLKEDFTGTFLGMKFQGMGIIAFDTAKKKFITTWLDSMATGFMTSEGTYDEASKTLTSHGEETMKGMKVKTKDVMKIVSDDEQHFEMFREFGGKEVKMMEITLTRAKDMKKDKKEKDKKDAK